MKNIIQIFALLCIIAFSQAFERRTFFNFCEKVAYFYKSSIEELSRDCLVCRNVIITPEDTKTFSTTSLDITVEECIKFVGGDLGIVNSDFFKQFPNTKYMSFESVKMSLKSSEEVEEHPSMVELVIKASDVRNNRETNALHSLIHLKKLILKDCYLEFTTLDKMLLEQSTNLTSIMLIDNSYHIQRLSNLKNLEEDFFDDFQDLEVIYLMVQTMTEIPSRFFEDKSKLTYVYLEGGLKEFPVGLPETITDLTIAYFDFKHICKEDFENLKNLKSLSMHMSKLQFIDEDTFEDLADLQKLDLSDNNIKEFSSQHLTKKNKKLKRLQLRGNPCQSKNIRFKNFVINLLSVRDFLGLFNIF